MNKGLFSKTRIATSLCLALGIAGISTVQAETATGAEDIEVIQVKGIRGSLQKSLNTKRDANGVVDAITAEDIGKFPDTNLAESLQRITGVAIDRVNGEGSKVTVRGFGPEFNLVTLNDRIMPTAQASGESTRSFEFANLSSDSVSAVEVYKTGQANLASGGIGSTINIRTARPFDNPGTKASFGIKGHHDTGVVTGDKVTPELSGILSQTLMDDRFGIGLSASHTVRNSNIKAATVDGWRQFKGADLYAGGLNPNANVEDNNQNPYDNYFYARNIGFASEDIERKRTNAQLVLQFAPVDTLELTADYTYSKLNDISNRDTWGLWFDGPGSATDAVIDENGTFVKVTEQGGDYSGTMHQAATENENKSLGFNAKWNVSDNLTLRFDAHNSSATSDGDLGDSITSRFFIAGALNIADKFYDASSTEIPLLGASYGTLNPAGEPHLQPEDYATLFAGVLGGRNETNVAQYQFDGTWENASMDSLTSIDFGLAYTEMDTHAQSGYSQHSAGWYGNKGQVADFMSYVGLSGNFLDGFSGGGSDMLIPYYYTYDQNELMAWAENEYDVTYGLDGFSDDHKIKEKTTSAFVQFNVEGEFNNMPIYVVAGLRYEQTDVEASSLQRQAESIFWMTPTEWGTNYSDDWTPTDEKNDYRYFLPNLDVKLEIQDNLLARFSYSKTMTRANLGAMRATTSLTAQPKVGGRTGFAGNTQLKPYLSDNIDLSLEYYYGDASYVSLGFFNKDVENFQVNTTEYVFFDHIKDPFISDAANQAREEIINAGGTPTDYEVFNWLIANGYGDENGNIQQADGDPLAEWQIIRPNNVEDLNIYGMEFAAQHWFGETGFGAGLNYTYTKGDTHYDVEKTDEQFALPGLSDTANFSIFYDKYDFTGRLAYNWRDKFLSAMGQAESGGPAPQFTEAYGQLDFSLSYAITEQISLQAEGINILGSKQRIHGRYAEQMLRSQQNEARYALGARFVW
ncbi:TonB-dependent receptor [Paraferrimonas sedimenticola]|uniref:TonB-dependent receptor n=1 Tax=Paraferrimonas sedimenticola TaxID=375674 RepID=A0AA37W0W6_9GAMM|nr:TonB-dependent receptor [Paraferrimonas sedimenticola]GLP96670.1 TonB-dependent receptor [Paraferrimonas sedimenticola]